MHRWLLKAVALLHRRLATILFPFFFGSQSNAYEVTPEKLRQEAEYNTVDETDAAAAEAQSGENESDPDLDLCPPASPVGNTFWCQCGECFARDRRQDCACCFDFCRARGENSLSVERLHVDLQLSRSTCHCLHAFSFSYLFWTALRDFLDMTERPLSVSPSNK